MTTNSPDAGPTHKAVEAGVTLLIALFGAIVIYGSVKAGINWGAEGPRAGFFPFYIGISGTGCMTGTKVCSRNGDSCARS
jgi:putative tricarboxylic transport membrane protein